ncbi:MAG: PAS domain-containing sensor histidine kinase [Aromatoleum sp.]|jgi:two-component system sensor histidine kinase PilS (NtrC family)|uniref:sensor histidine kinase n=1 Tax=Aromatoleum sp. TaxID=2307007 RepID=UPI002894506F|nr:PAS domain-containing sensor histidine kinase [Aromatoleum sp.]MDT3672010.1 PAS domain-containing sensor histidine kinase [Aromatoleum sp.]
MRDAALPELDPSRWVPLRYLNFFRLVVAGLFLVAGRELNLGEAAPNVFVGTALAYGGAVLALGFPDAARAFGLGRLITIQLVIDIVVLTVLMWASGGYRSGMPVLMMVILAGAGLVAEGRMVLFFASLATVAVLAENAWRYFSGGTPADFLQVGFVCIGFFGIAITARLLALRAKANESLAVQRGEALAKQQAVNERIIRDMQDGVLVLGSDGRITHANPRATELLGSAAVEGRMLTDIDPAFADCRTRCAGAEGRLQRLGASGKLLRCRAVGADANGTDGDTLIYLTDFEEVQMHVQQLKLAALGRLTASMAHEIRNPLAAVTQAAELLTEEKRGDVQLRLVRIINDNARRIERMIRDVLALGRRGETLPEALVLAPFVASLVEEFALGGDSERGVFGIDIAAGATLAIDRAHLHQILGNLLGNARRYASGGAESVRIFSTSEASGQAALHVVDDGPGIAESERARVFEPFFTMHPKGTGLGLYIARELAEANGATLELRDNAPGAHFVLTGRSQP